MSSLLPPVPPRPTSTSTTANSKPPVPPLPPDYVVEHHPMIAPRPHRLDHTARSLDDNINQWSDPSQQDISDSLSALSFNSSISTSISTSTTATTPVPSLTAPLPTIANLSAAINAVQNPAHDPALKLAWCRDIFFLVDRSLQAAKPSTDPQIGPVTIHDPHLARLATTAVPIILSLAASVQSQQMLPWQAEAVYIRAILAASGAYPDYIRHNPRSAFRDFESAAKGGYPPAWFRLGRDYENFNDFVHAKDCFERGVKLGVENCTYRIGMAHLLGQLGLNSNPQIAIPLLHRAATLASLDVPQPAYVYALLLLSEFTQITLPLSLFAPYIPQGSSTALEARKHLERAAYLGFAPAQYKLGHAYEFAQPPFSFDPLLSVQYYSLASQQGEAEADMALSKWFLCGSPGDGPAGGFDKDEALAWTFADKAARKGLPSAEFAMGYYAEVGVGGPKDIIAAIKWYTIARDHGNADAAPRLAALQQPSPQALSRQEHDTITESKLVRTRTQAKQRSDAAPHVDPPLATRQDGRQVIDVIRKNSVMGPQMPSHPHQRMPTVGEYQQPQDQPQKQPQPQPQYQRMPTVGEPQQQQQPLTSSPSSSPALRPQKVQQYPASQRYTLTDSPSPRIQSPARPSSGPRVAPGGRGRGGRYVSGGTNVSSQSDNPASVHDLPTPRPTASAASTASTASTASNPNKQGPTTFAEMGFQGARAEDKECIVM